MAKITIRLSYNLETGKKDVLVDFISNADALPIEHEQQHKEIIEELLGKGILRPDEVGAVRVQRVSAQQASTSQHTETNPEQTLKEQGS